MILTPEQVFCFIIIVSKSNIGETLLVIFGFNYFFVLFFLILQGGIAQLVRALVFSLKVTGSNPVIRHASTYGK